MIEALDRATNQPVRVDNAGNGEYICPHCGDRVVPCRGSELSWHYRHTSDAGCVGVRQPSSVGLEHGS